MRALGWGFVALSLWACSGNPVPNPDGGSGGGQGGGTSGAGGGTSGTGGGTSGTGGGAGGGVVDGGVCSPSCGTYRACCNDTCVNTDNDPFNCGGCFVRCTGTTPFCGGGTCMATPCDMDAGACGAGFCCGLSCCAAGDLCCVSEGSVSQQYPSCFTPTTSQTTCNPGCAPLCASDREAKRAVTPIDERQVLERLSSLPISTWSYRDDPSGTRHLGPMAQDFHDAFSLGATDKAYDPIDVHGVSLAALKALNARLDEQQRRIERLEAENEALRQRVCR